MQGKLIIFSAPSGSGKTTIVQYLVRQIPELEFSISACSREKRKDEKNGKDYYFISVDEFKKRIKNNEFVEWEEVYENNFYGTLKSEIERIWAKGKHVIFDVDVVGGLNLKNAFKEKALAVFVKTPSLEHLKERLQLRQTENAESLKRRVDKALYEIEFAPQFDYILVNDNIETAFNEAKLLVDDYMKQ